MSGPAYCGAPDPPDPDSDFEGSGADYIAGWPVYLTCAICEEIHQDGSATYSYGVREKYSPEIVRSGYKTLPSKAADSDSLLGNSAEDGPQTAEEGIYISLMDNPCVDNLNLMLDVDSETSYSVELFDLSGRRVRHVYGRVAGSGNPVSFNVSDLPSGTYFVRATTEEAQTTRTICIVH